jgi:long-chain acyl-CoA synthetase
MKYGKRLFDFVYDQQRNFPLQAMLRSKTETGWTEISTDDFIDRVNRLSMALIAYGIRPGDRVSMVVHANCLEWNLVDHAVLQVGAVDVPIYPTMTVSDYRYILNHSGARLCFVSNADLHRKVMAVKEDTPSLERVFSFEKLEGAEYWENLIFEFSSDQASRLQEVRAGVKEEDLATIIYTSGTTGTPKGVMLSHGNIASNVIDCEERLPNLDKGQSHALSFLPCCHIFERMLHYLYINNGVSISLTGMDAIKDDLIAVKPHIFTGVPRLFEKFYDGIVVKARSGRGIKRVLFNWAHDLAIRWEPDGGNGWWYSLQLALARAVVFSKVKKALGLTGIRGVASGSAALQPRLARFFNGAGIWLMEGYGLTETSPVISVNTLRVPRMWRAGTVGKIIRNVEVKIAEDGEICCKGPNVMLGYYHEPEITREVLRDGWFHTGDIGEWRDGFLAITDRKKEMFKTSGGKYIAPQLIENALKESLYIEQCMVIGDGQRFPGALIVPDFVQLRNWCAQRQLSYSTDAEMIQQKPVLQLLHEEVELINARFAGWERIKAFRLLPRLFSIEEGEITPTLKLKRKGILHNYRALTEEIYQDSSSSGC